jgi:hypothetical protein
MLKIDVFEMNLVGVVLPSGNHAVFEDPVPETRWMDAVALRKYGRHVATKFDVWRVRGGEGSAGVGHSFREASLEESIKFDGLPVIG